MEVFVRKKNKHTVSNLTAKQAYNNYRSQHSLLSCSSTSVVLHEATAAIGQTPVF